MLMPNSVNVSLHIGYFILSVFNILMNSIFPLINKKMRFLFMNFAC